MSCRPATLEDLPALLRAQRAFYEHEGYPFDDTRKEQAMRQLLGDPSLGRVVVLQDDGGGVAGYLVVAFGFSLEFGGRDAFVDELFVFPEWRGRGLGTEALDVAENVCREAGVLALHLEVEFTNEGAKRLYARRGYTEHSRQLMTRYL